MTGAKAAHVGFLNLARLAAGLLLGLCQAALAQTEQHIPLLLSASGETREGFVRVINRSSSAGSVAVVAIDDSGREFGPVRVTVDGGSAINFSSRDLESGNAAKGIARGIGQGQGNWRLVLRSELSIRGASYVRTGDGFVTAVQDIARRTVAEDRHSGYHVPTFNPGSNERQRSFLRLVNTSSVHRTVTISGVDDHGSRTGEVRVSLRGGESRSLTAEDLENGAPGVGGAFGTGSGKWRLLVSADSVVLAMSLLESPGGHLANISGGGSSDYLDVGDPDVRELHRVPLLLSASHGDREGFVRIVNHSERSGEVRIRATDDAGHDFGPVRLAVGGMASVNLNSRDLERGNRGKGLSRGVGDGQGEWRLELESDLPIEVMAYVRTADGFVTNMQDTGDGDVTMFNPGSNTSQRSSLRLVNTLDRPADVTIEGVDDGGAPAPGGVVRLILPGGKARTLAARSLEQGGEGLRGRLGDGRGKWRLSVSAPEGVLAMSLLESPTGHLSNLWGGAHSEPLRHVDGDGDGASDYDDAFPDDPARQLPENGISTTVDDQIVLELRADETSPPSLFDLGGKTLLFRSDGEGGHVRSAEPLEWETDFGEEVGDQSIVLEQFEFPFSGSNWGAMHVNVNGNITFGQPLGRPPGGQRFAELGALGGAFAKGLPTIAALYKPYVSGRRYVNRHADRVVVTWSVWEFPDWAYGIDAFGPLPATGDFQAVLFADGSIAFNYRDVSFEDGIVGLFPQNMEPMPRERLATLSDAVDDVLPGHLDLVDVSVWDTDSGALAVDFTVRGDMPEAGHRRVDGLHYSFYVDVDEPLMDGIDFADADFSWRVSGDADRRYSAYRMTGDGEAVGFAKIAPDRIRLLISMPGFEGGSVAAFADAFETVDGATGRFDQTRPAAFEMPAFRGQEVDLSTGGAQKAVAYEAFHFRSVPDANAMTCRLIHTLGDGFDFVVLSAEFRLDQQTAGSAMARFGKVPKGLGLSDHPNQACSEGTLKGFIYNPIYMNSEMGRGSGPSRTYGGFNFALSLLGHEMGHVWTVRAALDDGGEPVRLYDDWCGCHWRWELHAPAMAPWGEDRQASAMGGGNWEENADGTFTRVADDYFVPASGFSPFDLYLMGLLDASEVPDSHLLIDPVLLRRDDAADVYTARKKEVSIGRIIDVLGPRVPAAGDSQKEFNVGFVYLVGPGSSPSSLSLRRHAAMRDKFAEYWGHVTGGRSGITTEVHFDSSVGFGRAPTHSRDGLQMPFELIPRPRAATHRECEGFATIPGLRSHRLSERNDVDAGVLRQSAPQRGANR